MFQLGINMGTFISFMTLVEVLFSCFNVRLIAGSAWQMISWQKTFEWQFLSLSLWWSGILHDIPDILIFQKYLECVLIALYCVSLLPRTSKSCSQWSSLTWEVLLQLFWRSGMTSWKMVVEQLGKLWENQSGYLSVFECMTSKKNC